MTFSNWLSARAVRNPFCVILVSALCITISAAKADDVEDEVLALADSALDLISVEDFLALSELMIEESMSYTTVVRDGEHRIRVRTWAEGRDSTTTDDLVERGFNPTVHVSGPLATVWYPYDFYNNGEWSHCGVDVFVMGQTGNGWRIMTMAWNALQPPDCDPHPDGAP